MLPFLQEEFGNPHSTGHSYGWSASDAVAVARGQVADLINADDDEIVFTSGSNRVVQFGDPRCAQGGNPRTPSDRHCGHRTPSRARNRGRSTDRGM